ncbi:MAG TPA: cytochrome c biogenesis protein ResB [Clostridia bacterium]|nr:cytochrome c biogenesis protein ResB [Clostridia bacterium]
MISLWQKFYKTFASVRTGIILIILVGVLSAIGTFILQRPTSELEQIQRAYSPNTLMWLDRLGLTDVFHAWWFALLLTLVSLSIIFASLERWPNAWRFYARPYRRPEPHFRAVLPHHTEIPIRDGKQGIEAAERAFRHLGFRAERVVDNDDVSLFAERNRISVMAVYIVHASLLLIFCGGILDAMYGYRGYLSLTPGETNNQIEVRQIDQQVKKTIPFSVRCDATGQENYPDGTPKKWWSKLAVIENGQEVKRKEIVVNDPLVHRGIRLYQAGYGSSGKLDHVELLATVKGNTESSRISLALDQPIQLDAETSVKLVRFVPDAYVQDNEIFTRSTSPENPAFQLAVLDKAGSEVKMWLMPRVENLAQDDKSAYAFRATDMKMKPFTGLEVSFQPGQWAVWAGVLLMAAGLAIAFYVVHMRFWAVAVNNGDKGTVLWIGGAFNKNRERFEERYKALVEATRREIEKTQANATPTQPESRTTTTAGV